ncbi:MAG: hypothetical protein JSS99_08185 [Actinobacteria bacterium]|nr:hypothetical protein [Actinomycetota bacterium]
MTILNEDNLLDRRSEQIPSCAPHGELYLTLLAKQLRACQAPCALDVKAIPLTSGPRAQHETRLVLTPTESRLKHFPSLHFARPIGTALLVGYDLVGAKYASGWGTIGLTSQESMDRLEHLMDFVEENAIVPAMQQTAAQAGVRL